jgi:3-isopropylmalate/(R)-2-methylmalate dehydratase large subunit
MKPATFAEKLLARQAGVARLQAGEIVDVQPDIMLTHDNTAAIARIFSELPVDKVRFPDRMAVVLDHAVPAPSALHAQNHAQIRSFVDEQSIGYFSDAGRGICHQVLCEDGLIGPGTLILGADSHSTHYGALGAFGASVGRSEMAALWARGELWLRVPESIQIELIGNLPPSVFAKDLALKILGELGADGALYRSVEFTGSGLSNLPVESRMVLTNMMAEAGAKNAYVPPDEATMTWLAAHSRRQFRPLFPDPGAEYHSRLCFQLDQLEAMIALPHKPEKSVPLADVDRRSIQQAFLGTCTNGRLDDLAAAAEVLQGRRIATSTRMIIVPASARVLQEALAAGYIETFIQAGAMIGTPGCGPCMGNHFGIPAAGEVCISTANRNFHGRMGEPEAEIYLASPQVVAASAVAGMIAGIEDL